MLKALKILRKYFPWIPFIGVGWVFVCDTEVCLSNSMFHFFGSAVWQAVWIIGLFCWLGLD